ncbi:hypothetical protein V8E51_013832 [Hyaloscypha variabilis]
MTVRERQKQSLDKEGLLGRGKRPRRRKGSWYNCCVFGGISGLCILALLLTLNLLLVLGTFIWASDIDTYLQNWGKPGSGTEGLSWYPTDLTRDVLPIPCHSHNDYWRRVPLFSALRAGCISVESDVWLFDNELYVGHNTASLQRNRTFQSLYVNPIVQILEQQNPQTEFYNGSDHGVFDVDPGQTLTLLIDVKTGGAETWPWVLKQLEPLRERGWLSYVEEGEVHIRPVTVVGTGNTPFDVLTANSTYRDAFFDAPLETMWEPRHNSPGTPNWPSDSPSDSLDADPSEDENPNPSSNNQDLGQGLTGTTPDSQFTPQNSYYASVSFGSSVGRIWRGRLTPRQLRIIRGQIRGAHRRGLKVRYWDLPAWPLGLRNHVWDVLVREGVDILNVDDLRGVGKIAW